MASVFALACFAATSIQAATFASFDPVRHNRFLGDGSLNPGYLLDHNKITGMGVRRAMLISPQHYLTATHTGVINPTFVAADGTRVTMTADAASRLILNTTLTSDFTFGPENATTTLPAGSTHFSDLMLVKLTAPVPASITPLAVLGGNYFDMLDQTMIVNGQGSQTGTDTIDFIDTVRLNTGAISESLIYRWDHPLGGGSPDELTLVGGDSGEGSLVEINGQYVVTGANMGIATVDGEKFSFNTFVTPYLDQISARVLADGHSITVVAVPEPSMLFAWIGLLGVGCYRLKQSRARSDSSSTLSGRFS